MSNLAMAKPNIGTSSEHSARKVIHEVSHFQQQLIVEDATNKIIPAGAIRNHTDSSPLSRLAMRESSAARKSRQHQPSGGKNTSSVRQSLNDYRLNSAKPESIMNCMKPPSMKT